MDESAAALDVLEPRVAVTYAEAGGWGRALMVEARRRGVPSAGVQHGFIYRHWLNYLHEPDEMDGPHAFPRPDVTLLYDRYAAEQLMTAGSFPAASVHVTGSARLEALASRIAALAGQRESIRERYGVEAGGALAVLTAKHSEIHAELPALLQAADDVPGLRLVIKPHPAETPGVYAAVVAGRSATSVAPANADLAELLAAADLIVSMNSTVAIDGLVLGIPALVVGLPNNLSPFVDAGVMAGADGREAIGQTLQSVLYDRQVRHSLGERGRAFADRYGLAPHPGAAVRAAHEILSLARPEGRIRKPALKDHA
jgi:hypothetical protein